MKMNFEKKANWFKRSRKGEKQQMWQPARLIQRALLPSASCPPEPGAIFMWDYRSVTEPWPLWSAPGVLWTFSKVSRALGEMDLPSLSVISESQSTSSSKESLQKVTDWIKGYLKIELLSTWNIIWESSRPCPPSLPFPPCLVPQSPTHLISGWNGILNVRYFRIKSSIRRKVTRKVM